jgi:hypothetical protein
VNIAELSIFRGLLHAPLNHTLRATNTNPAQAPGIRFHRPTEIYLARRSTIDVRIMIELPYFELHSAPAVCSANAGLSGDLKLDFRDKVKRVCIVPSRVGKFTWGPCFFDVIIEQGIEFMYIL